MHDGQGVAVTRAAEDCGVLVRALEARAVRAIATPLLRYAMLDLMPLVQRIEASHRYDWLVCTSRHAVQQFDAACHAAGVAPADTAFARVAAVGKGTAAALRSIGLTVDALPTVFDAAHLASALLDEDDSASRTASAPPRVLFPCAAAARDELPSTLRRAGWIVDEVACYDTLPSAEGAMQLADAIGRGAVGAVTLASGSACRAFAQFVPPARWAAARLVSIGPTTTAAALAAGLTIAAESPRPAMEALAETAQRVLLDSLTHA